MDDDPMLKGRGTIANTLAQVWALSSLCRSQHFSQARASLLEPSRPFTPADSANSRSLFKGQEYTGFRPQTADCYKCSPRPLP